MPNLKLFGARERPIDRFFLVGNFGIWDVGCGKVHWENENVGF